MADRDHLCGWSAHGIAHHLEEDGLRSPTALDCFFCINYGIFLGGVGTGIMGIFLTFVIIVGGGGREWSWGAINLFQATPRSLSHWARSPAFASDQALYANTSFSESAPCPLWVSELGLALPCWTTRDHVPWPRVLAVEAALGKT